MADPSYRDEKRLVEFLIGRLEERLSGRDEPVTLKVPPSDHCQLGVLAPWSVEHELDDQPPEELEEEVAPGIETPPVAERSPQPALTEESVKADHDSEDRRQLEPFSSREDAGRRPPSALGLAVAFARGGNDIELSVTATFAVYSRHFPDYEEQRRELGTRTPASTQQGKRHVTLVDKFRRHTVKVPSVRFVVRADQPSVQDDGGIVQKTLDNLGQELREDVSVLRQFEGNRVVPIAVLQEEKTYERYITSLTGPKELSSWRATIRLRAHPTSEGLRIEIHLCNDSQRNTVRPSNDQYSSLFDAQLSLVIEKGDLLPIELLPVPEDYQYDRSVYALGRNAGSEVSADRRTIKTRTLASYEQPRMTTHDRIVARYDRLAEEPFGLLTDIWHEMEKYASDWRQRIIDSNSLELNEEALAACAHDLEGFEKEIESFCAGIGALRSDPRLEIAFRAMNRAFARGDHATWRLFQIVFVVNQLPALVIREGTTKGVGPGGREHCWDNVLDRADILWFPTGGGKTEAYFGLIACAALYDRLRGKERGVTAWLRFPLRMLSVQQLQRAVRMLWEAEQERLALQTEHGTLGDPLSLGYFVGSANTPNQFFGQWSFDRLEQEERQRERLLLVPDCPACKGQGTVTIQIDRALQRVRHVCGHCDCDLPVYVSDDEIYRFQPTLLVGTVDKIAAIGYQPKVASLWIGPEWRCSQPGHGYGNREWCVSGCPTNPSERNPTRVRRQKLHNHDSAPTFHIQDELHLLQEELGAFAGHYETMVRANERAASGRPSKVLAATATIAGYSHQAKQIYGVREVDRFPNRGYDLRQTFYSIVEKDPHSSGGEIKVARIFNGFRPPFLRPADAAARCAEILHAAINRLQADPLAAAETIGFRDARTEDEIRHLLSFYARTLTYVGKRDSGVRIRQRLEQNSARPGSELSPRDGRELNVEYLSSHSSLKEIAATIKRAEAATPWADANHLDATVATHVISHGVDVEYFNLMVLERIPEAVGDYIQVSSRSGRQHVGLIITILPRYSLRASSIYDRFAEFHRHLDRMVSPVAVNRFAKAAAVRSFPGVLLGTLYGRHLNALVGTKELQLRRVATAMSSSDHPLNSGSLNLDLRESYGLGEGRYDTSLETQLGLSLDRSWERFLFEVRHPSHNELIQVFEPRPMSSLRDVDIPVAFRADDTVDWRELRWFEQGHT